MPSLPRWILAATCCAVAGWLTRDAVAGPPSFGLVSSRDVYERFFESRPYRTPLGDLEWPQGERAGAVAALPDLRDRRMPGEFENQEFLLLGCGELTPGYAQKIAEIAHEVWANVTVAVMVCGPQQRQMIEQALQRWSVPVDVVRFWEIPHDTKWVRDYGPIGICGKDRTALVDPCYEQGRPNDDQVPAMVGAASRMPVQYTSLAVEGGNLLSNGQGICITTEAMVNRNQHLRMDEAALQRRLRADFGATETVILEPLAGEPTGHVDMFATFVDSRTVVVGAFDPAEDRENAALLDRNAARLAVVATDHGPLRVERIPMGSHRDNTWRTYTNCVFANGILLAPVYNDDPNGRSQTALAVYRRLLPGWRVVAIDATDLIRENGALHCITGNIPRAKR